MVALLFARHLVRETTGFLFAPPMKQEIETRSQIYKRITDGIRNHTVGLMKLVQEAKRLEIWKEKWSSWQEYCEKEFGFSRQRAYQLIDVAETIEEIESVKESDEKVSNMFDTESGKNKEILHNLNTRQATALKRLPPGKKAEVLHAAITVEGGKPPTQATINGVRKAMVGDERDYSNVYCSEPRVHTTAQDSALAYEFAGYPKTIAITVRSEDEETAVRRLIAEFTEKHGENESASKTPVRDLLRKLTSAYKELTGKTLIVTGADAGQIKRLVQINGVSCTDEIVLTFRKACQAKTGFWATQSHQLSTFVKHYGNIREEVSSPSVANKPGVDRNAGTANSKVIGQYDNIGKVV